MAETGSKIFDLDALTDIADNDVLVEVDVSDTTDSADGTNKKITVRDLLGVLNNGWIPSGETWSYSSVDDPTGVISCTDADDFLSAGMRISFVNGGNTTYGIITAVTSTTITFLHEIDPTDSQALHLMANSAITVPRYSTQKAPLNFPLSPDKWKVGVTDSTDRDEVGATNNQWYNLGGVSIDIPIGLWKTRYDLHLSVTDTTSISVRAECTLSKVNNTEDDTDFTCQIRNDGSSSTLSIRCNCSREKILDLSTKDTYYLNSRSLTGTSNLYNVNNQVPAIIEVVCAYL